MSPRRSGRTAAVEAVEHNERFVRVVGHGTFIVALDADGGLWLADLAYQTPEWLTFPSPHGAGPLTDVTIAAPNPNMVDFQFATIVAVDRSGRVWRRPLITHSIGPDGWEGLTSSRSLATWDGRNRK